MDWHTLVLALAAGGVPVLVRALWDRVPTREAKQSWWEREVRGLRDRVVSLEAENKELKVRVGKLEAERDSALIKLAQTIIERDDAREKLKSQSP